MNQSILNTDTNVLPKNKKMWSSWNSYIPKEQNSNVSLTYNMNILQSIKSKNTFCVSINMENNINPSKIIKKINYSHPTFNKKSVVAQSQKNKISGNAMDTKIVLMARMKTLVQLWTFLCHITRRRNPNQYTQTHH